MTATRILIADDEPSLVAVLQPVLSAAGYEVAAVADGKGAVAFILSHDLDVVLLDLGLPDIDGKEVIRRVREHVATPIIVISARHLEAEKIAALDEGADDYVNKPFEIGELMARIRAATRRRGTTTAPMAFYRAGPLAIDFPARRVLYDGETIKLSPKEWELLQVLARSAGQVVTHKRLLAAGWGVETTETQYLRVYIGLLRQKIEEDPSDPRLLLTEPGVGYRLSAAE
ncbi:response regulator transcription factor [Sphingomonas glacialis]|uniref:DNA-binding response regulator n=1 Tax=Sphingomonas glacialis TaxID=658225 RepID=A0A502FF86_9SPHN|nr:response regulator transcription factor [Sphingomonas glacialis]TPG48031.1 DNA-binding response regulator [Sphingomonas glacialis]